MGAPLKPLRDDSALRALSSLGGLRGAPVIPPLCRETQSLGQQMLNATVDTNGLINSNVYGRITLPSSFHSFATEIATNITKWILLNSYLPYEVLKKWRIL